MLRSLLLLILPSVMSVMQTLAQTATLKVSATWTPVNLRGFTRPVASAIISAEAAGRLESVNYDTGETVMDTAPVNNDVVFINLDIENNAVALKLNEITTTRKGVPAPPAPLM